MARTSTRRRSSQNGIALVVTLVAISLLSILAMALALSSSVDRLAASNHDEAVSSLNLADAALELAARDLAAIHDWAPVLAGTLRSARIDGPPGGVRTPWPGLAVDLTTLTNELTCQRPLDCLDPDIQSTTLERPWGLNNPRWRLFVYTELALPTPHLPHRAYVVVWLGDDGSEVDGDPLTDGGGPGGEGRYILRARAEAFGPGRARRALEADLRRVCPVLQDPQSCLPGIRVQSWRLVGTLP